MEQNQCQMNNFIQLSRMEFLCDKELPSIPLVRKILDRPMSLILVKAKLRISFEQTTHNRNIDPSNGRTDGRTDHSPQLTPQYRRCRLQNVSSHLTQYYNTDWTGSGPPQPPVLMISKIILRRLNWSVGRTLQPLQTTLLTVLSTD